jgi:hypothetical protein
MKRFGKEVFFLIDRLMRRSSPKGGLLYFRGI